MSATPPDPVLRLIVNGPLVGQARIPLSELAELAEGVQQAVRQIGLVIQTGSSRVAGKLSASVEAATRLELVGLTEGSASLAVDFPVGIPRPFAGLDLGALAVDSLVTGIESLGSGGPSPDDWDDGVYRAVSKVNRALDRGGVSNVAFTTRSKRTGSYTKAVGERVKRRLERDQPMEFVEVVGRLMMVDFHADKRRCRIEPPRGRPVECTYPLDLRNDLRDLAQMYVRADGYAEMRPDGGVQRLSILRLSPVSTPAGVAAESAPRTIDSLVQEQEPSHFETAREFVDPRLWSGEEEVDAFLAWVDDARNQATL
jgi:hypothetical protein